MILMMRYRNSGEYHARWGRETGIPVPIMAIHSTSYLDAVCGASAGRQLCSVPSDGALPISRIRRQPHPRQQPKDQRQRQQNAQQLPSCFLLHRFTPFAPPLPAAIVYWFAGVEKAVAPVQWEQSRSLSLMNKDAKRRSATRLRAHYAYSISLTKRAAFSC